MKFYKNPNLLFPFFMAFCMSGIMSFTMLAINVGFVSNFFPLWMRNFSIGFTVAVPTAIFFAPRIRKFVTFLCK